jgi:hypothetical protein
MKTAHLDVRVEPALIDKIDSWRNLQPVPPSRASAISYMLQNWLDEHGTAPVQLQQPRPLAPSRR